MRARAREGRQALHLAALTACLLALAARFCLLPMGETDTGFHAAFGRLLLAGHFPRTNTLSWTAADHPWYPTAWGFDVLCALVAPHGPLGFELLAAGLFLAALLVLALACAEAAGDPRALWMALPAFFLLRPQAVVRPHVASWLLLALALWLGQRALRRVRAPAEAPATAMGSGAGPMLAGLATVALGSNLHPGASFAAFALGCFAFEGALRARGEQAWPWLAAFAAAPLLLLCNPGGLANLQDNLDHFHVADRIALVEFQRTTLARNPAFFALAALCLPLSLLRLRRSTGLSLATLVFIALGWRTERLTQLLYVTAPVLLSEALPGLLARLPEAVPRPRALLLLLALLTGLAAWSADLGRRLGFPFGAQWDERVVPVRAVRFLEANGIQGRGFNSLADGGYLAYARPQEQTFADGRIMAFPKEFFPQWLAAERSPAAFQAWLVEKGAEYALATRLRERHGGYRLLDGPGWALVYWDQTAEVWLRRDIPRYAPLIERFEYKRLRPYGSVVGNLAALDRAGLLDLERELQRFFEDAPSDPLARVVACGSAVRQQRGDAEARCAQALEVAGGRPEVLALLAKARALPAAR
jgi:hypothetical protein